MDKAEEMSLLQYAMTVTETHTQKRNRGYIMRHFYFRLILGIVCLAAAVVSAVKANIFICRPVCCAGYRISMVYLFNLEKGKGQNDLSEF